MNTSTSGSVYYASKISSAGMMLGSSDLSTVGFHCCGPQNGTWANHGVCGAMERHSSLLSPLPGKVLLGNH